MACENLGDSKLLLKSLCHANLFTIVADLDELRFAILVTNYGIDFTVERDMALISEAKKRKFNFF